MIHRIAACANWMTCAYHSRLDIFALPILLLLLGALANSLHSRKEATGLSISLLLTLGLGLLRNHRFGCVCPLPAWGTPRTAALSELTHTEFRTAP
jgi:hypothetical protein